MNRFHADFKCLLILVLTGLTSQQIEPNLPTNSPSSTKAPFNYCSITCNGKQHTMCKYPKNGPQDCRGYTRGLGKTEKQVILDVHNDLRQEIAMGKADKGQPLAANMGVLAWSDEAAEIAQRWADQCTEGDKDDECRSLSNKDAGGQNIAVTNNNTQHDLYFFQKFTVISWFKNGESYDNNLLRKYQFDQMTHQYTQIIWAKTSKIGCGFSFINGIVNGTEVYRLVCNYYPAGNIPGEPVYLQGVPCSKCPSAKCSDSWPALCSQPTPPVHNIGNEGERVRLSGALLLVSSLLVFFSIVNM